MVRLLDPSWEIPEELVVEPGEDRDHSRIQCYHPKHDFSPEKLIFGDELKSMFESPVIPWELVGQL